MRRVRTNVTKKLHAKKFTHGELPLGRTPHEN